MHVEASLHFVSGFAQPNLSCGRHALIAVADTQHTDALPCPHRRAELIELNIPIVDKAIQVVNSALASSMEWAAIEDMVAEATARGACGPRSRVLRCDGGRLVLVTVSVVHRTGVRGLPPWSSC